ncbi:MAG TPA: type II toxin-antitoxin system VapC family toxin [Bryobacteraceae bacterium]|nr:type II toxin-antitoxin system VapC family toxin [Bryobacteraceae bacterium]
MLYLDTSALIKLYLSEPESARTEKAVRANAPWLATSRVTYAEALSVLHRCLRDRRISQASYKLQKKTLLADWNALHVVEATEAILSHAGPLIERHSLRGFDAIHLCSALWLGQPLFACFDDRLRNAAAAEGLSLAV